MHGDLVEAFENKKSLPFLRKFSTLGFFPNWLNKIKMIFINKEGVLGKVQYIIFSSSLKCTVVN